MAVKQVQALLTHVDEQGQQTIVYPINRVEDVAGMDEAGFTSYTHSKSGTVHTLTPQNGSGSNLRFVATAPFAAGDTIQVGGKTLLPKLLDGEALPDGAWATGAMVVCFLSGDSLFFRAGGGLNKSVIIVTAPSGSTLTCTCGGVTKTAVESNGTWTFRGLDLGEWTIQAVKGQQKAAKTVNISRFTVEYVTITYFAAYIQATWPAGSTCKVSSGGTTITAPNTTGSYQFTVPNTGTWTVTASGGGQSDSKTVSITADGQSVSVALSYRAIPEFTFSGDYAFVTDDDQVITNPETYKSNWKIRLLTSGDLNFSKLNGAEKGIDLFLVGGGGRGGNSGGAGRGGPGGGGGGYTKTIKGMKLDRDVVYPITIGGSGGATTAFGNTAEKGESGGGGESYEGYPGGAGGSGGGGGGGGSDDGAGSGGGGGTDGGNGIAGTKGDSAGSYNAAPGSGGNGQKTTTKEFGEISGKLYSGGGGGGGASSSKSGGSGGSGGGGAGGGAGNKAGTAGTTNTGGGGGGACVSYASGGPGGSGIVIIRNARG